jgi:hypothetical protein
MKSKAGTKSKLDLGTPSQTAFTAFDSSHVG